MKKLLTLLLVLIACSVSALDMGPYDTGAARKSDLGTMAAEAATDYVATDTFTGHTDATGSSVHGLGTISTKAATDYVATSALALRLDTTNASISNNLDVAGNVAVSGSTISGAGTAAAPAYTTVGDTNTGIYFPAADSIGISVNGSVVGRVDSSRNFGLGAAPTTNYRFRLQGLPSNTAAAYITAIPQTITTNRTTHSIANQLDSTLCPIDSGITDSGYRRALSCEGYIKDENFKGTLQNLSSAHIRSGIYTGTGTVVNNYGLYLENFSAAGSITNNWALYQATAAAKNYFAGNVLIGTTTDDGVNKLQVNGSMRLVGGAAPGSPTEGSIYFNSTDKHFYGYNGTAWVQLDN